MFVLIFAGSFSCQCHVGFRKMEAEGACSDVNECDEIAALCGHGDCQNLPGTYLCQCHFGFRLSETGTCEGCMTFPLCLHIENPKIQQTKMLVMCQRFGDWFLIGLVWPYSSNQKNIMKVGSKSLLLTCSSTKL